MIEREAASVRIISSSLLTNPNKISGKSSKLRLGELLSPYAAKAEADLARWAVQPGTPPELAQAMRYCTLGGGKRLRPALVMMSAEAAGAKSSAQIVRRCAVAIEMIHCYSLVHDDLPAMDDDDLRRGMPAAHVKFGEAMAILAGDALLTRAFAVIGAGCGKACPQLVQELADGAGCAGMIAGQVADMALCNLPAGVKGLDYIHLHKTAALISSAVRLGGACAGAGKRVMDALGVFGRSLGLAFQLVDDLLDATGESARIGKTAGKDAAAGKRTHVAMLGIDKTRQLARKLTMQAIRSLDILGARGGKLRCLAELLQERTH